MLALAAGCASDPPAVTLNSWRQSLERYVWEQGNGDPNVLRDLSWDNVHKGFAVLGDPIPQRSTDAIGLLLAHRMIQGTPYFIFLVGLVREGGLVDVRPVALQVAAGKFDWFVGPSDAQALASYRRTDRTLRDAASPAAPPAFPAASDRFDLTVDANRLVIRHAQSAAHWALILPTGGATQSSRSSGASSVPTR